MNYFFPLFRLPPNNEEPLHLGWSQRWNIQFRSHGMDYDEGAWIRTQEKENKEESGWKNKNDARRRMLFFRHHYGIENSFFGLKESFIFLHYTLPREEFISFFQKNNYFSLFKKKENFLIPLKEDFILEVNFYLHKEFDKRYQYSFPENYEGVNFIFRTKNILERSVKENIQRLWEIKKKGIRRRDIPENGKKIRVEDILPYFPAHFEVGAGASIDAGIPPLHYLHKVYGIRKLQKKNFFSFRIEEDSLLQELIFDTFSFFQKATKIHFTSLFARPNLFWKFLGKLKEKNLLFEPIYTNNFDGFHNLFNVKGKYVRRLSATDVAENISFHPDARSLFVVGVHADRRKIEEKARKSGLQIIYVDPESFIENGKTMEYKLESIKKDDFHLKMTADDFARAILKYL